jgi:hypothetical protein
MAAQKNVLDPQIAMLAAEQIAVSQRLLAYIHAQGGAFTRMTLEDCKEITDVLIQRFAERAIEGG